MMINRRRFLTALGLGGLATALPSLGWNLIARAGGDPPPKRLIFWITAHGTVPSAWNLAMPSEPTDRVATRDLGALSLAETPVVWQALHDHRRKLTCVEGLAQTTMLAELAEVLAAGTGDDNHHNIAQAHLLTVTRAHPGDAGRVACLGGGPSLDQVIGDRTRTGARWASRVYGANHDRPYCYRGELLVAPRVDRPAQAFADAMGIAHPTGTMSSRDELIRAGRGSVLDLVADEYMFASRRLGIEGRRKLEQHAQLVRELEVGFSSAALVPRCELSLDTTREEIEQWNRLITLVLACDMSRVITFVAPVIEPSAFGYPAEPSIHDGYAHSSYDDGGEPYRARSEAGMVEYNAWYARRFAGLLSMLDAIPEGSGSVLDHSNVVWLTELATGTHQHGDVPIVMAGGGDGFFTRGSYFRYPRTVPSPWLPNGRPLTMGPSVSHFYVSLMRAMGLSDESFGREEITLVDGTPHSLRGPLDELIA